MHIFRDLEFPADLFQQEPISYVLANINFIQVQNYPNFWLAITSFNASFPCEVLPYTACPTTPVDQLRETRWLNSVDAGEVRDWHLQPGGGVNLTYSIQRKNYQSVYFAVELWIIN